MERVAVGITRYLIGLSISLTAALPLAAVADQYASPIRLAYPEMRELFDTVVERYPPNKFHYVTIGGSPTPLSLMFRVFNIEYTNIAMSNLAGHGYLPRDYEYMFDNDIIKERIRAFNAYFDEYFAAKPAALSGKDILVIDYIDSGATVLWSRIFLEKWAESRHPGAKVRALALYSGEMKTDENGKANLESVASRASVDTLGLGPNLSTMTHWRKFKPYAEYPRIDVSEVGRRPVELKKPIVRPEFLQAVNLVRGIVSDGQATQKNPLVSVGSDLLMRRCNDLLEEQY